MGPQGKKRIGKRTKTKKTLHVDETEEAKGQMMNRVLGYRGQTATVDK